MTLVWSIVWAGAWYSVVESGFEAIVSAATTGSQLGEGGSYGTEGLFHLD